MSGDVGLVVNPKPGANVVMAGFGGAACAVAVMLVLFWAALPVFAQPSCPDDPAWGENEAGTVGSPYQVETLCQLQGIRSSLTAHYELVKDIIATPTANWNVEEGIARGFEPIASGIDGGFTGSFVNGGDHVISSLYINRPNTDNVGLFSRLAAGAMVRGVILTDSDIKGGSLYVGSLVGLSRGMVQDSSVTGSVTGMGDNVGGLAGRNLRGGSISNSYAAGSVSGTGNDVGGLVGDNRGRISSSRAVAMILGNDNVGGLAGSNRKVASISYSSVTGSVTGMGDNVGGLVGDNYGQISSSRATGLVTGMGDDVGGLVGDNYGQISSSRATGLVTGMGDDVGGLVGSNRPSASVSYSSAGGLVSGKKDNVGGLVGGNEGSVSYSYAVASVSGNDNVGGLVGYHVASGSSISNSYATGWVLGNDTVGGLVGYSLLSPEISNNYATGSVWGNSNVGGLVGQNNQSAIDNSYYARGPNNGLGTRRSFEQLRCTTELEPEPGANCPSPDDVINYAGWDADVWNFGTATELPQLRGNPNPDLNFRPYIGGRVKRLVEISPIQGSSLVFEAAYEGPPGKPVTLTWSLAELPDELSSYVYFSLANGMTATTTTGRNTTLSVTLDTAQLVVGEDFYVVLMSSVSDNDDRIRVRVAEAGQPSIDGLAERIVGVGNDVSGFTNLVFEAAYEGPSGEPVTLTWSLAELPPGLEDLVYFSLANGMTATTTTGRNTTLSVTRNVAQLAAGTTFEVVLMNNVATSGDSVRIQTVNARQPTIHGSTERVVLEGTVPGTTNLIFEVANAGHLGESVILTWSLSELPTTLTGLVYFDLGGDSNSTGIETIGLSAKLVVARHEGFPVPANFYLLLMNNVSVYDAARVWVRVVEEGQPVIADPVEQIARVGPSVSGFSNLVFEIDDTGSSKESITWTWSLDGLPPGLEDLVYFSLANGMTATTTTGRNTTLSVTRNAAQLAAGTTFKVVLMNGVSTSRASVQVRVVAAKPPVVIGGGGIFAEDGGLIREIWDGSTDSTLTVEASDPDGDNADDLSWSFFSSDIAPGANVEFSGSTKGGVVELRVTRPLDLYNVGSFVLQVTSGFGAYSTVSVSIVTVCATNLGDDLDAGQTGDGTFGSPYQIRRLCQLQDVRSSPSAYYELAADIDASPTRNWNDGDGFEPIALGTATGGGFSGSFVNSSSRVITGLTIDRPSTDNVGLFSRLAEEGTIRDVILMGSRTTGRNNVGSLVGSGSGVIEASYSSNHLVAGNDNVGGLVGYSESSVSVSYATGLVAGNDNIGGLVGYSEGSVSNSYATGRVLGFENVGGLVGSSASGSTISYTYSLSTVTGTDPANRGGLVGNNAGDRPIVSYFTDTDSNNGFGEFRTRPQMRCPKAANATCLLPVGSDSVTYADWDPGIWDFGGVDNFPKLRGAFAPNTPTMDSEALRIRLYLGGATR